MQLKTKLNVYILVCEANWWRNEKAECRLFVFMKLSNRTWRRLCIQQFHHFFLFKNISAWMVRSDYAFYRICDCCKVCLISFNHRRRKIIPLLTWQILFCSQILNTEWHRQIRWLSALWKLCEEITASIASDPCLLRLVARGLVTLWFLETLSRVGLQQTFSCHALQVSTKW